MTPEDRTHIQPLGEACKFSLVDHFDQCRILVIGDMMIDEYVWGEVDRISPEAPVQIVSVTKESYTLGGAGNVVNNLVSLGAKVRVAGIIGDGVHGELLVKRFGDLGVDTGGIVREPGRPTTRKTRIIAASQHVLRIDRETREPVSGRAFDRISRFIEAEIPNSDAILISDYGKGLITASLMRRIVELARLHEKVTLADPKGLDFSKYSGVAILTPNKKEASLAAGIDITDESTLFEAGDRIIKGLGIENLLITCGSDGMVLFERDRAPFRIKANPRQVYDVSGAGDTVISVLGLSSAAGASFKEGAAFANTAAGIVVGKVGTATVSRVELAAALNPLQEPGLFKHIEFSGIPALMDTLRKQNKRIVFTNGCFDLLHAGHIRFFSASKQMGDILIVAIDDDDSVKRLKGPHRPVIDETQRVRILGALDCIDYVTVFSTEQLETLIDIIRPDVLTKGSNTPRVSGSKMVEKNGGQVVLIPVTEDISSSRIIEHIKNPGEKAKDRA